MSTLLLDLGNGMALRGLLAMSVFASLMILMPLIDLIVSRVLTSSFLWMKWHSWARFVHAALPLKILIGQMAWKFVAGSFGKLEGVVRDYIVDLECAILEESIPVTINEDVDVDDDMDGGGVDEAEEEDEQDLTDDLEDVVVSDDVDAEETDDISSDDSDYSEDDTNYY